MAALPYLPHTQADIRAMLDRIGAKQLDDLYTEEHLSLMNIQD